MLTHRKKRPLQRNEATRDARLIVIATEGEKTESIYFSIFRSTKVKLRIICSEDGRSAPRYILENMEKFKSEYQLDSGDELWLVVDRDCWEPKEMSDIASACRSKGIMLAVSNPCFELWLAHHFGDPLPRPMTNKNLESHLKTVMSGYNKSKYDPSCFRARVELAIQNAKQYDDNLSKRWPHPIGTRVHVLISSILGY